MSGEFTYGCWNKFYKRELIERAKVKFAEHVAYEEPLFVYPLYFYVSCILYGDYAGGFVCLQIKYLWPNFQLFGE